MSVDDFYNDLAAGHDLRITGILGNQYAFTCSTCDMITSSGEFTEYMDRYSSNYLFHAISCPYSRLYLGRYTVLGFG